MADASAQPVSEKYEEIVSRLGKVVERLEGGGLSLEESIAAFEEGILERFAATMTGYRSQSRREQLLAQVVAAAT